jgi:hypothetical protein
MFKPVRVIATVLLFASIIMTFVSAFVLPAILCIIFVIVSVPGVSSVSSRLVSARLGSSRAPVLHIPKSPHFLACPSPFALQDLRCEVRDLG